MKKKMITLAMVLFTFLSCSNKDYFDEGHVDLTPGTVGLKKIWM